MEVRVLSWAPDTVPSSSGATKNPRGDEPRGFFVVRTDSAGRSGCAPHQRIASKAMAPLPPMYRQVCAIRPRSDSAAPLRTPPPTARQRPPRPRLRGVSSPNTEYINPSWPCQPGAVMGAACVIDTPCGRVTSRGTAPTSAPHPATTPPGTPGTAPPWRTHGSAAHAASCRQESVPRGLHAPSHRWPPECRAPGSRRSA
uniref:Uncharacterized protein n=1 Tax=Ralstonia pickettii TaxID=329 RepID=A2Q6I2_RALPI|nr:unknown [Ralstonia pickettii]